MKSFSQTLHANNLSEEKLDQLWEKNHKYEYMRRRTYECGLKYETRNQRQKIEKSLGVQLNIIEDELLDSIYLKLQERLQQSSDEETSHNSKLINKLYSELLELPYERFSYHLAYKFPVNKTVLEEQIGTQNKQLIYVGNYKIDLLVPWLKIYSNQHRKYHFLAFRIGNETDLQRKKRLLSLGILEITLTPKQIEYTQFIRSFFVDPETDSLSLKNREHKTESMKNLVRRIKIKTITMYLDLGEIERLATIINPNTNYYIQEHLLSIVKSKNCPRAIKP